MIHIVQSGISHINVSKLHHEEVPDLQAQGKRKCFVPELVLSSK